MTNQLDYSKHFMEDKEMQCDIIESYNIYI